MPAGTGNGPLRHLQAILQIDIEMRVKVKEKLGCGMYFCINFLHDSYIQAPKLDSLYLELGSTSVLYMD